MTILQDRVRELLAQRGVKGSQVSHQSGVNISRLLAENAPTPTLATIEKLARYFGVQTEELVGFKNDAKAVSGMTITKVPVVGSIVGGDMNNLFPPGSVRRYIPCPKNVGKDSFALEVEGESMSPYFNPGDIVFVDASKVANPGRVVAVIRPEFGEEFSCTLKKLVIEGGKYYLKALNPEWKPRFMPMEEDMRIVGVVVGKFEDIDYIRE